MICLYFFKIKNLFQRIKVYDFIELNISILLGLKVRIWEWGDNPDW